MYQAFKKSRTLLYWESTTKSIEIAVKKKKELNALILEKYHKIARDRHLKETRLILIKLHGKGEKWSKFDYTDSEYGLKRLR